MNQRLALAKPEIGRWRNLKFGMFIHWGLYSILGRGEWAMFQEQIDKDEYKKLADVFSAEKFNAELWADVAKVAGMKYMVFTTRHHDGFSLFDSKSSIDDFTSMHSAAKCDFVAEYTEACRKAGLDVGLYYSPNDWRSPASYLPCLFKTESRKMREQCHKQIEELMTNYGKINILWYDAGQDSIPGRYSPYHVLRETPEKFSSNPPWPNFWEAEKLDHLVRTLQPGIMINNRFGTNTLGDFGTPECKVGAFDTVHPWESCERITDNAWGWRPNSTIKSLRQIIHLLVKVVTGDGNLLFNVGPKADGTIEPDQIVRLLQVGKWLDKYGESIYNTRGGPIVNGNWGGATWNGNSLYIHILEWNSDTIKIPLHCGNVMCVTPMTASDADWRLENDTLHLTASDNDKTAYDTIFKVEFDMPVDEVYRS